jgi:hypothetical protein
MPMPILISCSISSSRNVLSPKSNRNFGERSASYPRRTSSPPHCLKKNAVRLARHAESLEK